MNIPSYEHGFQAYLFKKKNSANLRYGKVPFCYFFFPESQGAELPCKSLLKLQLRAQDFCCCEIAKTSQQAAQALCPPINNPSAEVASMIKAKHGVRFGRDERLLKEKRTAYGGPSNTRISCEVRIAMRSRGRDVPRTFCLTSSFDLVHRRDSLSLLSYTSGSEELKRNQPPSSFDRGRFWEREAPSRVVVPVFSVGILFKNSILDVLAHDADALCKPYRKIMHVHSSNICKPKATQVSSKHSSPATTAVGSPSD
ncbi:uncharacterized protein BDR25DRAFT_349387 [Lindgomyces ingoldianus]|uniref:Uncharacterized protein n=1 Tax=Lindgomyces ingoldianus TaxID=673940 RepID=A0ACB6RB04_9PLEO|nr:uncharacterized protein BDR25DRAFT_349387 [Lindgomyces ingoldianus]KAF2476282.1 hypothetical protein BDR25DRAFT_349387 [Lindgomyces ingoldianus]